MIILILLFIFYVFILFIRIGFGVEVIFSRFGFLAFISKSLKDLGKNLSHLKMIVSAKKIYLLVFEVVIY